MACLGAYLTHRGASIPAFFYGCVMGGMYAIPPRSANIEDLIDDGEDGLLFEPDNEEALAAILRRLVTDEALRLRLGRQARLKVTRFRNWRRNAEIVLRAIADDARSQNVSPAAQLGSRS